MYIETENCLSGREEAARLLNQLTPQTGYAGLLRVGSRLLKCSRPADLQASQQVRIALASSFTIDTLGPALAVECHRADLWPDVFVDGFDLYAPHIFDANSPLYSFHPDIVFLAVELHSLVPNPEDLSDKELYSQACSLLKSLLEGFKEKSRALLVVHNFATPLRFPFAISTYGRDGVVQQINSWLKNTYVSDSQVRILDFDRLCTYHGKSRTTNPKLHYLGTIEISESFLPVLARLYMAYIKALKGITKKCLVMDLDGTLWGGVVGEDGFDGIRLARYGPGSEYRDFQNSILELHRRGVILAINSKNNAADALEVIRHHPNMLLRENHFGSIRINWNDKPSNLRAIAEDLNIGLDSMVFVDDNPAERAYVRHALPEVQVLDLPADPVLYARALEEVTDFEVLSLTEEDRMRGAAYASERERRMLKSESASFEEFIVRLKIVLTIGRVRRSDLPRVAQLTRKTNQFNLTARRYSDSEIEQISSQNTSCIYTLRVRDIFGEHGLVGVMMINGSGPTSNIDVFLLSCRVLGRGIEESFLTCVLSDLSRREVSDVQAEFIPTAKNTLCAPFYRDFGFQLISEEEGHSIWRLPLCNWSPRQIHWHAFEWDNDEPGA